MTLYTVSPKVLTISGFTFEIAFTVSLTGNMKKTETASAMRPACVVFLLRSTEVKERLCQTTSELPGAGSVTHCPGTEST